MTAGPAPYLRIVDEIAKRIFDGELRPGDRVPSTRQISKGWTVAIATATKVIGELRERGLVEAVAGVGTVVVGSYASSRPRQRRPSPRGTQASSTDQSMRAQIARTAIEIADAEGVAAVSMRRIAVELGVATMSLYRWVPGKDELTTLMMDGAFSSGPWPDPPPTGWRAQLEYAARRHWSDAHAHPWLARLVSLTRPQLAPNGMKYTDWSMRALANEGLDLQLALTVTVALAGYVQGIAVNLETETQAAMDTGISPDEWMEKQGSQVEQIMRSGRFPVLAQLVDRPDVEVNLDEVFEIGLGFFLDGVDRLITSHRSISIKTNARSTPLS